MNITFSIKQNKGGKWDHIDLNAVAGKSLEQFFLEFEGKEIVAEIVIDAEKFYFCGTPHWTERMARKGKAASFRQAVDLLRERRPALLKEVMPCIQDVAEVFPDSLLEGCTLTDAGEMPSGEG